MASLSLLARPKVNLFLHVTGRRPDGYHTLESLVVFAETGDRVHAEPSAMLSLSLNGPFAMALDGGGDNLVLRAALALQDWAQAQGQDAPGAALHLEKRLPLGSGIGGGSADAAATLLLLRQLWNLEIGDNALAALALSLGADVPVCLESRARMMRGIGEDLSDAPDLPGGWLVLVNPERMVSTPTAFARLDKVRPAQVRMPEEFSGLAELADWLAKETRNDLEPGARELVPEIGDVLTALAQTAPLLARMSGSGATCFGLFAERDAALVAARTLREHHPTWWIEPAPLSIER